MKLSDRARYYIINHSKATPWDALSAKERFSYYSVQNLFETYYVQPSRFYKKHISKM